MAMALTAVQVSDVPHLDCVQENASLSLLSAHISREVELGRAAFTAPKFLVIGHRGNGMNVLQSSDGGLGAIKENSILSFNTAGNYPVDFVEFDVQVTRDLCPVIFHDNFIVSSDKGSVLEKRVTDLSLPEFLSHGPQREPGREKTSMLRKTKDGKVLAWNVETDDPLCTLQEAFQLVKPSLGFNIELKFDDQIVYDQSYLARVLQAILQVVFEQARGRPIIFSTFQPDAALLVAKLQSTYPVFFLTNGGVEVYEDERRNSLEEAIKLCVEGGLQGVVSEVKGIFRNPGAVTKIKEAKLSLLTYGKLNNVAEAVYMQQLMGVEGVIVDRVREITEAVSGRIGRATVEENGSSIGGGGGESELVSSEADSTVDTALTFVDRSDAHFCTVTNCFVVHNCFLNVGFF